MGKYVTAPSVLITDDKYDRQVYSARDDEELFKSALAILRMRVEIHRFIYDPREDRKKYPELIPAKPGLTREEAQALPAGKVRAMALNEIVEYEDREKSFQAQLDEYELALKILRDGDGAGAWRLLRSRRDYEYEGIELVRIQQPDEK